MGSDPSCDDLSPPQVVDQIPPELAPLDPTYVANVLSSPPFVQIPGVINVRDLGCYPSETFPGKITKPNYLLRAAELSGITEEGKAFVRGLGIVTVFDLRSSVEIERYNTPAPKIDDVRVVHIPVFQKDYSPEFTARRYQLYASGKTEAFMELYSQILDYGGQSFGTIFRHIRDEPSAGCIFHCTAGKDRTGIFAALVLKLAGVNDDFIAQDYAFSRVGREPARAKIMARLAKMPLFASNAGAALNMFTCQRDTMLAFLRMLKQKYGGVSKYLRSTVGLSDKEIETIKNHILIPETDVQSFRPVLKRVGL